MRITRKQIENEVLIAKREILTANKGLPKEVVFDGWDLIITPNDKVPLGVLLTLQIHYLDGEGQKMEYNVAL